MKVLILGLGVSGLVAKTLFPDANAVSLEIGGQINHWETVKLYKDLYTDKLLSKLGLPIDTEDVHYATEHEHIITLDGYSKEFLFLYPRVKLGRLFTDFKYVYRPSVFNKEYVVTSYELFGRLYKRLKESRIKPLFGEIESIHPNEKYVRGRSGFYSKYDILISTLPAPVFWRLTGDDRKFDSLPIYFTRSYDMPIIWPDNNDCNLVMYTSYKWDRVHKNFNTYLYEGIEDFTNDVKGESSRVKYGRFISQENIPPKDVYFLGRFAEWNSDVRINDVVRKLIDIEIKYGDKL